MLQHPRERGARSDRKARALGGPELESELPQACEVVLDGDERSQLPVTDTKDVDLIDVLEALARGVDPVPLTAVFSRALKMSDDRVALAHEANDFHAEVAERGPERTDPTLSRDGQLAVSELIDHI